MRVRRPVLAGLALYLMTCFPQTNMMPGRRERGDVGCRPGTGCTLGGVLQPAPQPLLVAMAHYDASYGHVTHTHCAFPALFSLSFFHAHAAASRCMSWDSAGCSGPPSSPAFPPSTLAACDVGRCHLTHRSSTFTKLWGLLLCSSAVGAHTLGCTLAFIEFISQLLFCELSPRLFPFCFFCLV